jgi:hypothetical protein
MAGDTPKATDSRLYKALISPEAAANMPSWNEVIYGTWKDDNAAACTLNDRTRSTEQALTIGATNATEGFIGATVLFPRIGSVYEAVAGFDGDVVAANDATFAVENTAAKAVVNGLITFTYGIYDGIHGATCPADEQPQSPSPSPDVPKYPSSQLQS